MAKFMFLQRGGCEGRGEMSAEQMQEMMKSCMDWMKKGTDEGWLIDPGSGLSSGAAVVGQDQVVTDGPFAESKELVGGYSIVEAEDIGAACELAKLTIKMTGAGTIEVREIANPC